MPLRRQLAAGLLWAANGAAALMLLEKHVVALQPGSGPSMMPTLAVDEQQWLLVNKRARYGRSCAVGDLLVYRKPTEPTQLVVKRVLALGGDYVADRGEMVQVGASFAFWAMSLLTLAATRTGMDGGR